MILKDFREASKYYFWGLCLLAVFFMVFITQDFLSTFNVKTNIPFLKSKASTNRESNDGTDNNSKSYSILVYTSFFGDLPWGFVKDEYFKKCPCDKKCTLSYNKQMFDQSDVVIFHARDLPPLNELKQLHSRRPKQQRWGWFVLESPMNSPDPELYDEVIDFSISMSSKSNFPYRPYGKVLLTNAEKPVRRQNFAEGKTKHVAWFVSNCAEHRVEFAKRLETYGINVFVGGGCSGKFRNQLPSCNHIAKGYASCKSVLNEFKFYFSAENSFCPGYITEKYFVQGFLGNTIPIVLGGANYSDKTNGIPGSYIDPMEFESFRSFVGHLKMLDTNDTAYNEYFKWKNKWSSGFGKDMDSGCAKFICDVCRTLHKGTSLNGVKISEQISKKKCQPLQQKYYRWYSKEL